MNDSAVHMPAAGAAAFITLSQMLGSIGAKEYVEDLTTRLDKRADAIIASGGFISRNGIRKVLSIQAEQFAVDNGLHSYSLSTLSNHKYPQIP